jgi:phospholipid transport system substrate-binding protein
MVMKNLLWMLPCLALLASPAMAADTQPAQKQPDELVKAVSGEILPLLKKKHGYYAADNNRLYAMVNERILPYFDFRKMSQYVLGLAWRRASEAQKQRFADEFRKLLVRTYATALLRYNDQQVIYLPYTGKPTDHIVLVKTELKQTSGEANVPIYFTFYNGPQGWKVFDLTIDGVSLVTNYRKVYGTRIQKEGLDAVINSLAEQNRKAEAVAAQGSK